MFERFTDRARRVVVMAQEEARLLGHGFIGTEHLLLGLVHEQEGVAAQALGSLGISLDAVRARVREVVGPGGGMPPGNIPFTPRAKKVLELALREALQLQHNYIGTEHILLGLVREGEGVAAQVLVQLGADLSRVRRAVVSQLEGVVAHEETALVADVEPAIGELGAATGQAFGAHMASSITRCSLCGRSEERVTRMIGARGVLVCDECVTRAREQLDQAEASGSTRRHVRLRPRRDRPPDSDAATDAIERAVETAFDPELTDEERVAAIADGEHLVATARALRAAHEGRRALVDITVAGFRFVDADEAEVTIEIWFGGSQAPFRISGHAVRVGGEWKVSRDTFCHLARLGGVPCPPRG